MVEILSSAMGYMGLKWFKATVFLRIWRHSGIHPSGISSFFFRSRSDFSGNSRILKWSYLQFFRAMVQGISPQNMAWKYGINVAPLILGSWKIPEDQIPVDNGWPNGNPMLQPSGAWNHYINHDRHDKESPGELCESLFQAVKDWTKCPNWPKLFAPIPPDPYR